MWMPPAAMECEDDESKPAAIVPIESRRSPLQESEPEARSVPGEIPFLITHWLDGLTTDAGRDPTMDTSAVQSIRNATATLASAFESLGAFGQRLVRSIIST